MLVAADDGPARRPYDAQTLPEIFRGKLRVKSGRGFYDDGSCGS
jgi:hypothetical protein